MAWPSATEYDIYVNKSEVLESIPGFKGGKPKVVTETDLEAYSGGYCRVYPIEVGHETIALRCWYEDIGEAKERYQKIEDYQKDNYLPCFVNFKYIDKGISVGGKKYPIIRMEWFNGLQLNEFLDEHVSKKELLLQLADEFKKMVQSLHKNRIAHGDLQDGNILVRTSGNSVELKLVDYDSLVVPALYGWEVKIHGLPTYQHPKRKEVTRANEKLDYFSELVIYLSLCVYAKNPDLWKPGQEQRLLFSEEDLINPANSERFDKLKSERDPYIRQLVEKLVEFCQTDEIDRLQPLEEVLRSIGEPTPTPSQSQSESLPEPVTEPFGLEKFVPKFSDLEPIEGPEPEEGLEKKTSLERVWIIAAVLGLIGLVIIGAWFSSGASPAPTAPESVTQSATNEPERSCPSEMVPIPNSNVCLDVYEVTNKAYQDCVATEMCSEPDSRLSLRRRDDQGGYYGNQTYDKYPVIRVTWEQANIYCEFAQKRLPKAAEREQADNYKWPSEAEIKKDDTQQVGSTGDVSPQGIHNLADNVREWVDDASERVVKGLSFDSPSNDDDDLYPTRYWDIGFRCAADSQ